MPPEQAEERYGPEDSAHLGSLSKFLLDRSLKRNGDPSYILMTTYSHPIYKGTKVELYGLQNSSGKAPHHFGTIECIGRLKMKDSSEIYSLRFQPGEDYLRLSGSNIDRLEARVEWRTVPCNNENVTTRLYSGPLPPNPLPKPRKKGKTKILSPLTPPPFPRAAGLKSRLGEISTRDARVSAAEAEGDDEDMEEERRALEAEYGDDVVLHDNVRSKVNRMMGKF